MKYFCTHSDINYLAKGIALYRSLLATNTENFILYYLCLDDATYEKLLQLDLKGIEPVYLLSLELKDAELKNSRNNPASQYGNEYSQFCWTLTPYFIWYLLNNKIPKNESLLYCDADLYFYHNPFLIEQKCLSANASVGIHSHRFTSYEDSNPVGEFNAGAIWFKNDKEGKEISAAWKGWLLNPSNEYYEKYGTCGDQKYLDLFQKLWAPELTCVFDRNSNCAYAAPWTYEYQYLAGNMIKWQPDRKDERKEIQNLIFFHFSHFTPDFANNTYLAHETRSWEPEKRNADVRTLYDQYWQEIKAAQHLIGL